MPSVLQVIPSFRTGGVEQTALRVANYLAENDYASFVASSGGNLVKLLHPKVVHFTLPLASKNPLVIGLNARKLSALVEERKIDVIHARSRACGWSAYWAAKTTGKRFVTTYHGAYGQNSLKWYYNRVMACGEPVVVASDFMKNHVKAFYPLAETVIIPSGIDTEYFNPTPTIATQANALLRQMNVSNDRKVVSLLGRFTPIKGHMELLRAIQSNASLARKIRVMFIGDSGNPALVDDSREYAKNSSIDLSVFLDRSDLRPYFEASDIVVVPTIKPEAFGRVTVEAMSMKKCVIVNDLGASGEVLGDPPRVYQTSDSTANLAKKLLEALSLDSSELKKIGELNRARAISLYDGKMALKKHLDVYRGKHA